MTKVYLPEQEVGASDVNMEPEQVTACLLENLHEPGEMCFWWHSHVNMAVFWSATDLQTIRQLGNNGLLVASVFNKQGLSRTAVYLGSPEDALRPDVFLDDLPLRIVGEVPTTRPELDAIYEERVSMRIPVYPVTYPKYDKNGYPIYGNNYYDDGHGYGGNNAWDAVDKQTKIGNALRQKLITKARKRAKQLEAKK